MSLFGRGAAANGTAITSIVESFKSSSLSERDLAVALHDYVRDNITFGFTRKHDAASAEYTLERGVGHCTPKTELFVRLLREAGFEDATVVTVPIPNTVLYGLGSYPPMLQHSFTQVTVEGKLCRLDSYVVDPPLFHAAKSKLGRCDDSSRSGGWGIHRDGTFKWSGKGDAFSQYLDHTVDLERQFSSTIEMIEKNEEYLHNDLKKVLSKWGLGPVIGMWLETQNKNMETLRQV